jgi:hypothetical protein
MPDYPKSWPAPTIEGYGIEIDAGLIRTPMESGASRQRRRYKTIPTTFTLSFVVERKDLKAWVGWANTSAYSWFNMDLTSHKISGTACAVPHSVRFTSNLEMAPITEKYFRINVTAEMAPDPAASVPVKNDWIVGGTPGAPSTPDWYIAGTPAAPSVDVVVSGTPAAPTAHI